MINRLVDDLEGCIVNILFSVPAYEACDFEPLYTAFIRQLPAQAKAVCITVPDARERVASWSKFRSDGLFDVLVIDDDITPWSRDPMLVLERDESSILIQSSTFNRRADNQLATSVAAQFGLECLVLSVNFEGGNIITCGDHLLLGSDVCVHNEGAGFLDSFQRALSDCGLPQYQITIVGDPQRQLADQTSTVIRRPDHSWELIENYQNSPGTTQPIFHLDHYVTAWPKDAKGQAQLLVGDPKLAADMLGRKLPESAQQLAFDAVAEQLTQAGFSVIRNPLPLIYMDDRQRRRRILFFASSNNVLQQVSSDGTRTVWLPQFGHDSWSELAITDEANATLWRDQGYEVQFVPQALRLAENMGGLRCMTQVLKRQPATGNRLCG